MRRLGLSPTSDRLEAALTNDWFQTVTERLNTYSGAATPAASSIPQNQWIVFYNTSTGVASLITNRGGAVVSTSTTPAISVVTETSFGQSSAVGTSLNYARQDHTHGTPSVTTTTEGALINGATDKPTPVDADYIGLMDSAASNILKKLSWANLKATLKTYLDTLYSTVTHHTTHESGGSDSIKLDALAAPTDVTTLNATTSAHGLMQKYPGGTTTFLRADGAFASPTATAADPTYDTGTITIATETGRVHPSVVKLTGSEVLTINGTGQFVIVGVY